MKGDKHDSKKLRWDLLPIKQIEDVVKVMTYGARKYSDDNWKVVSNADNRYYSAALRHITRWRKGYIKDKETKVSHLAHAICCLLFLMWFERKNTCQR